LHRLFGLFVFFLQKSAGQEKNIKSYTEVRQPGGGKAEIKGTGIEIYLLSTQHNTDGEIWRSGPKSQTLSPLFYNSPSPNIEIIYTI
jgi:hypothetical protein